jgi:hypothetical protein
VTTLIAAAVAALLVWAWWAARAVAEYLSDFGDD